MSGQLTIWTLVDHLCKLSLQESERIWEGGKGERGWLLQRMQNCHSVNWVWH